MKNTILVKNMMGSIVCYILFFSTIIYFESYLLYSYIKDNYNEDIYILSIIINVILCNIFGYFMAKYILYRHKKLGIL